MIVMTIINSSSVNPLIFIVGPTGEAIVGTPSLRDGLFDGHLAGPPTLTDLPVFVFRAIQRSPLRFRINIEHILAAPGGARLGVVLYGA